MSAVNPRVNINPQDFLELESIETNGDESPFPEENDDDDDKDTEDHPTDDATVKDGEQPKTDGTTEPATETPKRARSEDAAEDMAAKLGMTNAQLNKAKQLVEKAANQGLSFHDGTTIELSDKTQLWKTTEQKFKFTQPGGDTSTMFAAIGIFVYDAAKGTLMYHQDNWPYEYLNHCGVQVTRATQDCRLVQMPSTSATLRPTNVAQPSSFKAVESSILWGISTRIKCFVVSRSSKRLVTKQASRRRPHSCKHSKTDCVHRQRSPGKLRIAQCYASISREIPSSKTVEQFAL